MELLHQKLDPRLREDDVHHVKLVLFNPINYIHFSYWVISTQMR